MNKYLLTVLLLSIFAIVFSQKRKLSFEAQKVKTVYEELIKNPNSEELQKNFIDVFPSNAEVFKQMFCSFNQLYDEHYDYINKFSDLVDDYPKLVGKKLVSLSTSLKYWDADAIGYIQKITMSYADKHFEYFINIVHRLNRKDVNYLFAFMVDVEDYRGYKHYHEFKQKLIVHNEKKLLRIFNKVSKIRIKNRHHCSG